MKNKGITSLLLSNMFRIFVICFCILCCLILINNKFFAKPRILINKNYDFGLIGNSGRKTLSVPIHNIGQKSLEITKVRAGCACISYSLPTNVISPQQTVLMNVTLNMEGRRAGVNREIVYLQTTDPERKNVFIYLNFKILGQWSVFPGNLIIFKSSNTNVGHSFITIANEGNLTDRIIKIVSNSPFVNVKVLSQNTFPLSNALAYKIRIDYDWKFTDIHHKALISFFTTDKMKSCFYVPIDMYR